MQTYIFNSEKDLFIFIDATEEKKNQDKATVII